MEITFGDLSTPSTGAVVIFATEANVVGESAASLLNSLNIDLTKIASISRFEGKKGTTFEITAPTGSDIERILVVGIGEDALNENDCLIVGATINAKLAQSGSAAATILADTQEIDAVALAEGALMRSYRFDKYRTKEPDSKKPTLTRLDILSSQSDCQTRFEPRRQVVEGVFLTRDLVSEPANILYPESFAARIEDLQAFGLEVEILGEAEMESLGMGSLLCVGQGSARESKLAIMRWNGGKEGDAPVAFIGKGVTFDTGGISLKPGPGMEQMKWDMGGAGTVVGAMRALAGRKAKVNAVGVVGLVENMPSGNATRPGDVVTSMSGQTIEVLNTDAEGRLVLADAMWYTQDRFKPRFMIDLATLTGAMIIALGHEYAGIFSDSDELSDQLFAAGTATGDKVWRLPIHENYDKLINCPTADMKNIGGRAAGSITAAQFLKRFTNDVPWVHIDIAGTVWSEKDLPLSEQGGTGHGVRLLDRFIADNYEG